MSSNIDPNSLPLASIKQTLNRIVGTQINSEGVASLALFPLKVLGTSGGKVAKMTISTTPAQPGHEQPATLTVYTEDGNSYTVDFTIPPGAPGTLDSKLFVTIDNGLLRLPTIKYGPNNSWTLTPQSDGNLVSYDDQRNVVFAINNETGRIGNQKIAVINDVQAETARAQAAEANLVSGTQSLDDYSLKITGIKSQYRDKGKTQPSGIEYIDSNGLYQMAITKDYADTLYAGIPSLQAETTRAQSAEAGLLPKTGGTISGDLFVSGNVSAGTITGTSDALDIIYGDGNRLSLQNDGNFVGYDKNRKILYALNAGGGTVGGKAIATTDDVQAETARAQAAEANLVSGTQSLDDYSLKITGIKSQYRDKGKTQPSGIEYIDSNGLYQMAITKDYADTLYAGIPSLQAETTRAQSAEAGLLPKTGGTISGDLFVSGNVSAGTITGTSDALDIIYGDGNRLSLQNDGNFVGYDKNRKILYALNAGGGTVGGKAIATTDDVQAETARAQLAESKLVSVDNGIIVQPTFKYGPNNSWVIQPQSDGNFVGYDDKRNAVFALGKDKGYIGNNQIAVINDVQAETARAQAAEANLVSGTQSLDDYSLKITGIKSQYRDKGKTQPSGIEYIDSNGLYQMAITKDYADTLYAGVAEFKNSLASAGWQRLPGGLIIQWMSIPVSKGTFSFPITFPTAALQVYATNPDTQGDEVDNAFAYLKTNSTFFCGTKSSQVSVGVTNAPCTIFAIGY